MLLEIFNLLNNITPLISTTTQATLIFNNNNIDYFTNVLLLTKFIFLFLSTVYLCYLYFYFKKEFTMEYIPNIFIPNLFVILLLTIVLIYSFFNFFFINPPKKSINI
jgi:hypothetical protein